MTAGLTAALVSIVQTGQGAALAVPGFEGYEAIAFRGDRVFVLVESAGSGATHGYLVAGSVTPEGGVRLDAATIEPLPPQALLDNLSYETLLATSDGVVVLQEANGIAVNPTPEAYHYDAASVLRGSLRAPTLEYRLTDATGVDSAGRFWVMNYFYPGDETLLLPAHDTVRVRYGQGPTHEQFSTVERLVPLRISDGRVVYVDHPPLQLELSGDGTSRNWEGLVRLDHRGFLLVTDSFPETMLAFVPYRGTAAGSGRHGQ